MRGDDCVAAGVDGDDAAVNRHVPVLSLPDYGGCRVEYPRLAPFHCVYVSEREVLPYAVGTHRGRVDFADVVKKGLFVVSAVHTRNDSRIAGASQVRLRGVSFT